MCRQSSTAMNAWLPPPSTTAGPPPAAAHAAASSRPCVAGALVCVYNHVRHPAAHSPAYHACMCGDPRACRNPCHQPNSRASED